MEQARELAEGWLEGRGGGREPEARAGREDAGGGLLGQAADLGGDRQQGRGQEGGLGGALGGMASEYMRGGDRGGAPGRGSGGGVEGMMAGMAADYLGGGSGRVGATTHEGAASMDAGLVDKLLALFEKHAGRPFDSGSEQDADLLHQLAGRLMGTSMGRDMLRRMVMQRMGL